MYVIFVDLWGYSTRLIYEQSRAVAILNQLVKETSHFRSDPLLDGARLGYLKAGEIVETLQPNLC